MGDDTLIDNANKNEPIKPQNISTHDQLTWAQRTKQKQTMQKREHDLFDLSSNHSKDSSTHSNGVKASSKIKTKIKNKQTGTKPVNGWSKVYNRNKTKIQKRNRPKSKSQQQRLHEAEEKKKQIVLEQKQKHKKIFANIHEKINKKQRNEANKLEQK